MPPSFELTPDLLRDYVQEMHDVLSALDAGLLSLERAPDDAAATNDVFRGFHSVKGTSSFLELEKMVTLAHSAEDLLGQVRDGSMPLRPDHLDDLFAALDLLHAMIAEIAVGNLEPAVDITAVCARLRQPAASAPPDPTSERPSPAPEVSAELLRDYVAETTEVLDALDAGLLQLEREPGTVAVIHDVLRGLHSIKGTSGFLGLHKMIDLAHAGEALLVLVRDGQLPLTPDRLDTLLVTLDYLRALLGEIEGGLLSPTTDITGVRSLLQAAGTVPAAAESPPLSSAGGAPASGAPEPVVVTPTASAGPMSGPPAPPPPDPTHAPAPVRPVEPESTVRLDVRRLDTLLTLAGELHLQGNRLQRTTGAAARQLTDHTLADKLGEEASALRFISDELRAAVLRTRMLPVNRAFGKLPRIVRDAARETGKEVVLDIAGEETELDRALIEEIGDPLVHLVRNAVDHGLESPAEREQAGKARVGCVRVSAYHEGNRVVICVADDGGGIDTGRVCARAVERGFLTAEAQAQVSEREALDLIFHPGFTTHATATALSGRGVGLDVVRTNIQRLSGVIEVETTPGEGTAFRMKIPLTLAVVHVLLVSIADEVYALPTSAVIESLRVGPANFRDVEGRLYVSFHNDLVPTGRLSDFVALSRAASAEAADRRGTREYLVVLGAAERRAGLVVERLTGQQEVVVKPLGAHLEGTPGVTGAAILDDGRVALVLDVAALVDRIGASRPGALVAVGG